MANRTFALTVILDKGYPDDDAQAIVQGIQMIKGVLDVKTHATDLEDGSARSRAGPEKPGATTREVARPNGASKTGRTRRRSAHREPSPAEKAWETMRERYTEDEISDRQREAAYKAWETRRRNAKKTKARKAR